MPPAIEQGLRHRQPVQPGAEGALATEGGEALPCPHENVLGQLFRASLVPLEPEAERGDPAGVGLVQLPECGGIALLGASDGQVAHGAGRAADSREAGRRKCFGMHSGSTPGTPRWFEPGAGGDAGSYLDSTPMSYFDTDKQRAAGVILILGAFLAIALWPFVSGLIGALVLYVIFAPVYRELVSRIPEGPSAAIVIVLAILRQALGARRENIAASLGSAA